MASFQMSKTRSWLAGWLLALGPLIGQAQTILVGPTRLYPTLQAAVAAGAVKSGTTVQLDDGVYSDACTIDGVSNVTITSACGRAGGVIFDENNQGNLAGGPPTLGKAIILVKNSPGLAVVGLRFRNVGLDGPAGVAAQGSGAGNQAGIRFENLAAPGTSRVSYCAFDGCVTGIFAAPNSNLNLTIDHCDFGYERSNGQARDGLSHDIYLGRHWVVYW